MNEKKILLIDDDPLTHQDLGQVFKNTGYRLEVADNSRDGLKLFITNEYDIILLDIWMPDLNNRLSDTAGLELLEIFLEQDFRPPIVMISELDQKLVEAIKMGANDYVSKTGQTGKHLLEKIEKQIFIEPLRKEMRNVLKIKKRIDKFELLKIVSAKGVETREFINILEEMKLKVEIEIDSFLIRYIKNTNLVGGHK